MEIADHIILCEYKIPKSYISHLVGLWQGNHKLHRLSYEFAPMSDTPLRRVESECILEMIGMQRLAIQEQFANATERKALEQSRTSCK